MTADLVGMADRLAAESQRTNVIGVSEKDGSYIAVMACEPETRNLLREAATELRALAGAGVAVHQAYWVMEDVWQDITAEQLAVLDETEAVTRTLYSLPPPPGSERGGVVG